jgi:hypothetical protein
MTKDFAEISERLQAIEQRLLGLGRQKEVLTFEEGMDILNVSRGTMNEYRTKSFFPFYKIGRKVYVKYSEIVAFIETNVERQEMAA